VQILFRAALQARLFIDAAHVEGGCLRESHLGAGGVKGPALSLAVLAMEFGELRFGNGKMGSFEGFPNLFAIEKQPCIVATRFMANEILQPRLLPRFHGGLWSFIPPPEKTTVKMQVKMPVLR